MTNFVHRETIVNGLQLHYVEAGTGPLVLLLHGFPEFWYSWRFQIFALAEAGFHVIAPDLRGYNKSDKPTGKNQYRIELLAKDVAELIHKTGQPGATVVGHDWGGGIAWKVASAYPDLVGGVIILNAPHPATFLREMKTLTQLLKSWYIFFFQLPYIPEIAFKAGNFALMDRALRRDPVRKDAFTAQDIAMYKAALSEPSALTAGINYYRANFQNFWSHPHWFTELITLPTLVIWGEQDRYLGLRLLDGLDQWVPNLRIEKIPQASHWVQIDSPEQVNELIIQFLNKT